MRPVWSDRRLPPVWLVLANAVPLGGVLFLGWDYYTLLVIYWAEDGVIGAVAVAKIMHAEGEDDPSEIIEMELGGRSLKSLIGEPNRSVAVIFVKYFFLYWTIVGAFVSSIGHVRDLSLEPLRVAAPVVVGLAAYHVVSYYGIFLGAREYEHTGPVTQMDEPIRRASTFYAALLGYSLVIRHHAPPWVGIMVMVVFKTAIDFRIRRKDRYSPGGSS